MTTEIMMFLLGLLLVTLGGDSFVGYGISLARRLRLPAAAVGATVVAVGTSLPEIVVSVSAALGGNHGMATGSALGSAIYNAALVGGLLILLRPAKNLGRRDLFKRLMFFLLAAGFTALSLVKSGSLGVGLGVVLLSVFAVYALTSMTGARTKESAETERPELIAVGLIVGAAALYMGSGMVVENGIFLAHILGINERLVALTFVALGTALPDIAAAVAAAVRRQPALALGNIVGANIINLLLVIGLPAVIAPMEADASTLRDVTAAAGAMLLLLLPPVITGRTYRWQGVLLLLGFAAFMTVNFV